MKKIISSIIAIICFSFITLDIVYASENENNQAVSSVNNNYLGIGTPGEIQKSETKLNGHMSAMSTPMIIPGEYNNIVYADNKWQPEILEYILNINGLRKFRIETPMCFVKRTTKSSYTALFDLNKESKVVYVFKDKADMERYAYGAQLIGYTNSYSSDKEDLMSCLTQNIINAGKLGGNVLLILKYNFVIGTESTTVGLGTSGVTGLLGGSKQATTFGSSIGYAKGKAKPVTYPFMHCMIFYSEILAELNK